MRVRAVCLKPMPEESGDGSTSPTVGANARRATEDSTTVGFIEAPGPSAELHPPDPREAEIALFTDRSGADAMATVLDVARRGRKRSKQG